MNKAFKNPEVMEQTMATLRSMVGFYITYERVRVSDKVTQVMDLSNKYLDWVEALPEGELKTSEEEKIAVYFFNKSRNDTFFSMTFDFAILACGSNEINHFADPKDYPDTYEMIKEEAMRHGEN